METPPNDIDTKAVSIVHRLNKNPGESHTEVDSQRTQLYHCLEELRVLKVITNSETG